jgi:cysteine desulfurase/selenocysteine lyase
LESLASIQTNIDIAEIRQQFPILHQEVNGYPLAYFDNAATNQKPQVVIDALNGYYSEYNSNIHRGVHTLAEKATSAFEQTRIAVQQFINAREAEEIIFTKGTTESINLVASTYGKKYLQAGDEILITGMEHHSNIVPWQMLCDEIGCSLVVIPVDDSGDIQLAEAEALISDKTKIVSVVMASNTLGTINPIKELTSLAHAAGAVMLVDAAQALSHLDIDVQDLGCDFLAGSAHKMYGPTGVGILYGKRKVLESMPPYQGGGEMIKEVSFKGTTYNEIPFKFEAGTPNIADIIAFASAISFIQEIGKDVIRNYEAELLNYAVEQMSTIPLLTFIGTAKEKVAVQSFIIDGMHPFDVGMMLDALGIAVRTGHHCTMPLMERFEIEGTVRASFAVYNTFEEIDRMVASIYKLVNRLK